MSSPRSLVRSLAWTAFLGLASTGLTAPAVAADLGLPVAPEEPALEQNVEFGTGWYIRGGVGLALQSQPDLLTNATSVPLVSSRNVVLEIGGGYQINNWLRTDATFNYYWRQQAFGNGAFVNCPSEIRGLYNLDPTTQVQTPIGVFADSNQCTPREAASIQKNIFLANAYIDLGTWYGITPYVGAGIGPSYIVSQQSVNFTNNNDGSPYRATLTLPAGYPVSFYCPNVACQGTPLNPQPHYNYGAQNWDFSHTSRHLGFAFAFMAGFAYDITDHMKIDVGYRYVNFGSFSGISSLSGGVFSNQVSSQEIRVGLRYMID